MKHLLGIYFETHVEVDICFAGGSCDLLFKIKFDVLPN